MSSTSLWACGCSPCPVIITTNAQKKILGFSRMKKHQKPKTPQNTKKTCPHVMRKLLQKMATQKLFKITWKQGHHPHFILAHFTDGPGGRNTASKKQTKVQNIWFQPVITVGQKAIIVGLAVHFLQGTSSSLILLRRLYAVKGCEDWLFFL